MKLENEVAIVTGSGGGIGRTTALRLAKESAAVIVYHIIRAGINKHKLLVSFVDHHIKFLNV